MQCCITYSEGKVKSIAPEKSKSEVQCKVRRMKSDVSNLDVDVDVDVMVVLLFVVVVVVASVVFAIVVVVLNMFVVLLFVVVVDIYVLLFVVVVAHNPINCSNYAVRFPFSKFAF